MKEHTYYTALGTFRKNRTNEGAYPVVILGGKEYLLDPQEMLLWSVLTWRLLSREDAEEHYEAMAQELHPTPMREFDTCLERLCTRGLVASGTGETGAEALYDMLSGLYVVPVQVSLPLRLMIACKLLFVEGTPWKKVRTIFQRDHRTERERQVTDLSRQALLSTAELIKCVETNTQDVSSEDKLLEALYSDEYTTDQNIWSFMRTATHRDDVTIAIANLYLRKQIIFDRIK